MPNYDAVISNDAAVGTNDEAVMIADAPVMGNDAAVGTNDEPVMIADAPL